MTKKVRWLTRLAVCFILFISTGALYRFISSKIASSADYSVAVGNGNLDMVRYMDRWCEIPHNLRVDYIFNGQVSSLPVLHFACKVGNLEMVKYLISRGEDINHIDRGRSALHFAVNSQNVEMVKYLLSHGAKMPQTSSRNVTLLHLSRTPAITEMLIKHGAPLNLKETDTGWTPLCYAVNNGEVANVQLLTAAGADVNWTHKGYGLEDLNITKNAPAIEEVIMLKRLQEMSATHSKTTPLHEACKEGSLSEVKRLVKEGAEVNALDGLDETPIDILLWQFTDSPRQRYDVRARNGELYVTSFQGKDRFFEILLYLKERNGEPHRFKKREMDRLIFEKNGYPDDDDFR